MTLNLFNSLDDPPHRNTLKLPNETVVKSHLARRIADNLPAICVLSEKRKQSLLKLQPIEKGHSPISALALVMQ